MFSTWTGQNPLATFLSFPIAGMIIALAPLCFAQEEDETRLTAQHLNQRACESFERGLGNNGNGSLDLDRHGATWSLRATAKKGKSPVHLELACVLCDEPELMALARATGVRLAARLGGPQGASLKISDIQPDDDLTIDDLPAPSSGSSIELESGKHRVRVVRGSDSRSEAVNLSPDERLVLSFEEMPETIHRPDGRRVGAILGGLGLAVAAAGASFLIFDGDCASTTVDASNNCSQLHDLSVPGWTLLATGAAALVTGLAVSVSSAIRRRNGEEESQRETEVSQ